MKYQQGSTLIMVLIVVLLVSIIATIALKDSIFGLRLSTNNQVDNLLLENSDAALFNLEDPTKVGSRLATNGVYGYFLQPANTDDILMFCYDANRADFFDMTRASVLGNPSKTGPNGYCTSNQFSSGRNVIISQVYVQKTPVTADTKPFDGQEEGISIGSETTGISINITATSISILPAFSNSNVNTVVRCFRNSNSIHATTQCLQRSNVPYNLQQAAYRVGTEHRRI